MKINIDDNYYNVDIIRKNNKNLYIRLKPDLTIVVTCPILYSEIRVSKLIESNKASIKNMIKKQLIKNKNNENEANCLLGKKINIIYKDVKKPIFNNNVLFVKDDKMLDKWYKNVAASLFLNYLEEAYYAFEEKIPYPKLKIRNMKTRWGVNNKRDNSVTLNLELIKKDQECLNYVIVHELSHFIHFNHSKAFWQTVEKYCPDYKRVRKELRY